MVDDKNSIFENSVNAFSSQNVKGDPDADKQKLLPSLLLRSLMIAICIGVFGYAVFMIASSAVESNAANDFYDSMRADANASAVLCLIRAFALSMLCSASTSYLSAR